MKRLPLPAKFHQPIDPTGAKITEIGRYSIPHPMKTQPDTFPQEQFLRATNLSKKQKTKTVLALLDLVRREFPSEKEGFVIGATIYRAKEIYGIDTNEAEIEVALDAYRPRQPIPPHFGELDDCHDDERLSHKARPLLPLVIFAAIGFAYGFLAGVLAF